MIQKYSSLTMRTVVFFSSTEIAPPDAEWKTLLPIMKKKNVPHSMGYSDGFTRHNALDVSESHLYPHQLFEAPWEKAKRI